METQATQPAVKPFYLRTWFIVLAAVLLVGSCTTADVVVTGWRGYSKLQKLDVGRNSAGAEILNQYKRRNDLIPNLVEMVKGEAGFEKSTLTAVTEARAKATSMQLTEGALNNPNAMAQFSKYQGDITTTMSRLMVASENYPQLKSNPAFREVRDEWAGSENRCAVARNRFIKATNDLNVVIRSEFPETLIARFIGMNEKPQFGEGQEATLEVAPKADLSSLSKK